MTPSGEELWEPSPAERIARWFSSRARLGAQLLLASAGCLIAALLLIVRAFVTYSRAYAAPVPHAATLNLYAATSEASATEVIAFLLLGTVLLWLVVEPAPARLRPPSAAAGWLGLVASVVASVCGLIAAVTFFLVMPGSAAGAGEVSTGVLSAVSAVLPGAAAAWIAVSVLRGRRLSSP